MFFRQSPRTVVLTTHSMEEAGALSSRMAIQVMGQLRCLGTPMHIKHKYGAGDLVRPEEPTIPPQKTRNHSNFF